MADSLDADLLGDKTFAGSDATLVKQFFIVIPEALKDFLHLMLMFVCAHFIYDAAKVFMKFIYGVVVALLAIAIGCGPIRTVRVDFSCASTIRGEIIITDCADTQTWKEWAEKHRREAAYEL